MQGKDKDLSSPPNTHHHLPGTCRWDADKMENPPRMRRNATLFFSREPWKRPAQQIQE